MRSILRLHQPESLSYILTELEDGSDLDPAALRQQSTTSEQKHDPKALNRLFRLRVRIRRNQVYRALVKRALLLRIELTAGTGSVIFFI